LGLANLPKKCASSCGNKARGTANRTS
jgi:hypothetical protein